MRKTYLLVAAATILLFPTAAPAESICLNGVAATIGAGDTVHIDKSLTVATLLPPTFPDAYDQPMDRISRVDDYFKEFFACVPDFNVYALVDGGRVATRGKHKTTHKVAGDGSKVPEAGSLLLLGSGLVGLVVYRRRARMK
jgi:hypothetical protein